MKTKPRPRAQKTRPEFPAAGAVGRCTGPGRGDAEQHWQGGEFGRENAIAPPRGASTASDSRTASASTLRKVKASSKSGALDGARPDASGQAPTTNQGAAIGDNQSSPKAGLRGPTRLEDILREKITDFGGQPNAPSPRARGRRVGTLSHVHPRHRHRHPGGTLHQGASASGVRETRNGSGGWTRAPTSSRARCCSATTASKRVGWRSIRWTRCSRSTPTPSASASSPMRRRWRRRPANGRWPTAGLAPRDIDAVVVSTCTGYLCPGLSGHVVERLGLRPMCRPSIWWARVARPRCPTCLLGSALLASGACEHVLSICVEVSSAAMYLDNDPGVLISACLFGDGAGAAVLSRRAHGRRPARRVDGQRVADRPGRSARR